MTESEDSEKLAEEVSRIDGQMAALAERKRQCLIRLSAANSPENQMSVEERREALADVLAEGLVYLAQRGMLPLKDEPVPDAPQQRTKSNISSKKTH